MTFDMTTEEVVKFANESFYLYEMDTEDREVYFFMEINIGNATPEELIKNTASRILYLCFYEHKYINKENFELCSILKEAREIETELLIHKLNKYYPDFPYNEEKMEGISESAFQKVLKNYDKWVEMLNLEE